MGTLKEKAQSILTEKNSKITPENIKNGVSVFDIQGTYTGIDTSDATAVAQDIADGKTAYVDGQKVRGSLTDYRGASSTFSTGTTTIANSDISSFYLHTSIGESGNGAILNDEVEIGSYLNYSVVASEINLTANKIKQGVTVLGIVGTYEGSGSAVIPVDYEEQEIMINCGIIAQALQTAINNNLLNANDICEIGSSGAVLPIIKLCDYTKVSGNAGITYTNTNSILAPCLALGIDRENERTVLLKCDASGCQVTGIVDNVSNPYIYNQMTISNLINALNTIGNGKIVQDILGIDGINIYNYLNYIRIIYTDSYSLPTQKDIEATGVIAVQDI